MIVVKLGGRHENMLQGTNYSMELAQEPTVHLPGARIYQEDYHQGCLPATASPISYPWRNTGVGSATIVNCSKKPLW